MKKIWKYKKNAKDWVAINLMKNKKTMVYLVNFIVGNQFFMILKRDGTVAIKLYMIGMNFKKLKAVVQDLIQMNNNNLNFGKVTLFKMLSKL